MPETRLVAALRSVGTIRGLAGIFVKSVTARSTRLRMSPSKLPADLAGVAGEYFVAAELSRRGFIASISLRNTRGIDILATNQAGSRSVTIQCKTSQSRCRGWVLNEKCEAFVSGTHFYAFVSLGNAGDRPRFHIVPSRVVAKRVKESHREWLATPGRRGQQHNATTMRLFSDESDEYLERWDLLGM